ncbi:MAG: hypothetical protein ABSG84_18245 [Acidobacteriaceae bacterium]|jgi:hypothetical protein
MNVRTTFATFLALAIIGSAACYAAASQTSTPPQTSAPTPSAAPPATPPAATRPAAPAKSKKVKPAKNIYTGPNTIVVLPPTPMLDGEGKQRVDPDGNLMFNPPVKQVRDKKGHPVFDANNKPVFQTATNLGYDDKGKKILVKKVKPPKMTPVSISAGTLTVDGWTGKARLNYDIADLKFMYIYAPGIGITIVSQNQFPGAKEQLGAFNDKALRITVDGHPIELASEKRLLGKKPQSAWVAVDRSFLLPSKFPVFGYGSATRAPYAWPGSKESVMAKGPVVAPPLPVDVRPTLLLAPCPAGMMRPAGPPVLPGQIAVAPPCVPIKPAASTAASAPATPPAPSTQ